ncbi:MAG TPA: ATP-binding protein [Gemmataceae bacterium]|jgi:heavy metal sensor kinase
MRSIRLSLMVCFLGLLAVALTTASLLVYRNAEQAARQAIGDTEQRIEAQYRERCEKEKARLDADLLAQAQSLTRLVQVQLERYRPDLQPALRLGVLTSSLSPNGYLLAPTWIAEGERGPRSEPPGEVYMEFRRALPPSSRQPGIRQQIKFDELDLPNDVHVSDYFFQIDSPPSKSYYSRSLGEHSFRLNTSAFEPDQVVHWIFDDTKLGTDTPVRRVVFKASGVGTVFAPRGPRGSRDPPPRPPNTPPPSPPVWRGPTIYVHCAAQTDKRDATLAGFRQQRDEELGVVEVHNNDSLRDLRFRLLAISLAVFAATGVGGFWLVRLGLSPLRRLSDAVSRVSTKDFRLPLDERPLPLELRPIAERLRSTLDLLKRAFTREKQATADISHELRTPLAALLTTTEFALRKPRGPEQYRELLNDVHASAQQMHQIVERLLTLARLDAGVDRLRVQSVDVAALARQCATVIRPLAEARGLKLTFDIPSSPTQAAGGDGACLAPIDPDKLREIVTNLLHNAIQYNKPGGSIDLRVASERGNLEVEVRDTGIGIAPAAREHIFERFYRADPSRNCDELHAGLGLAIVKEYIDLMGGSIGVESTEGQGSTFRVLLPVRQG